MSNKRLGVPLHELPPIKQELVVSRQPILFVNLKSNTMKNTLQIYGKV